MPGQRTQPRVRQTQEANNLSTALSREESTRGFALLRNAAKDLLLRSVVRKPTKGSASASKASRHGDPAFAENLCLYTKNIRNIYLAVRALFHYSDSLHGSEQGRQSVSFSEADRCVLWLIAGRGSNHLQNLFRLP